VQIAGTLIDEALRNGSLIKAQEKTGNAGYECGSIDHIKAACPRAFMLGAEEALQDPNIMTEKPEEKMRQLMSAKAKEKKQEEIVVVRDFPEVFLDDLSGLPQVQEIEFRIELIPEAIPVAKSPYRLAPSKLEELSG
ncbi:hypothetical protein Tco_1487728, partial [Tanacetum coccineum]